MKKITGKVDAMQYIEESGYPEVGIFSEDKWLKKFYKQLPIEVLEDWCKLEGLEYKPCLDNEPIHRMRVCMAILYKHFPKESKPKTKKKSKYSDYETADLIQLAIEADLALDICDDMRIMRMRAIMALRAIKVID